MSRITQFGATAPFALFKNDTDASDATYTGQRFALSDGREVTLILAGAVNLASGVLVQGSAIVANHQNQTVATAAAGATTVTFTPGNTAVTANQYAGGYLVINAGTGIGQTFKIQSHPAANASTAFVITLEDAIVTATSVSDSKGCLIANPYNGCVINPTTPTATPVGVTLYPITAANYGYVVSKGPTSCLADSNTVAVGLGIMPSTTTAGSIAVQTATGANIGRALQASVSAEARMVYVDL